MRHENNLFCHFWPNMGQHFGPKKAKIWNSLCRISIFSPLIRKTEAILIPSKRLKDWLTKTKSSKMFTFCYFWPKMGKYFVLISFNMVFLANLAFNFHSGISITTTFSLQMYTSCKIWKKTPLKYQFLCFIDNIGPSFAQI